ncbi:EF-hand domain-containing protein [Ruegeria pomeroyi]|jgi:Ca2+-binding EF-hand superfamily protein|uniref:EF hand domain protein n=2 Tax=Ruegeria pomeroyi TaxID=89184 RepID=Q5LPU2_RUEPO|nr:EF-hand domain-containing protein [Ruegeria pomeroyi]HCE70213.1 calcium-binding protein [Ruegeria sp.]AAV95998.1 EF hand domain protein [Ruegeria pomeroyi DSS-3]NVK97648.1 EF-hand domain-containing protein [Ruegeria pomeroyi]NVL01344.1 EF-hand domain-containing protein [Ruegeria pomeroyi]QWV09560.1 EF-hand domain-containing protein [Ruegeria pomeroyi]
MKHAGFIAALLLGGVALGASSALAMGPGGGMRHDFSEIDANGDGKITLEEMQGHRAAMFSGADTDGDGKLSQAEMEAQAMARAKERVAWMLERHDANKDGALSQDEIPKPGAGRKAGRMFDKMDSDGDGAISEQEFSEMQARGHGRHGMKAWCDGNRKN